MTEKHAPDLLEARTWLGGEALQLAALAARHLLAHEGTGDIALPDEVRNAMYELLKLAEDRPAWYQQPCYQVVLPDDIEGGADT
jgi:hypothetical protein